MPAEQRLMGHIYVKVGGQDVPAEVMNDLVELTVETSLHLPDMFVLRLHDDELKWVDEGPFELGKEVEIAAEPEEGQQSQSLIKAEITAVEPEFDETMQITLTVRGYDKSHRLHRGTTTQAYQNVTDSDLVQKVARQAGLQCQAEATSEVYPHVLQHNQTGMAFLLERARHIGYELFVEDKTLKFRKPSANGGALELEWGRELRRFRPRLTLSEQVDEVIVKGWDPKEKQALTGQASRGRAEPRIGVNGSGASLASSAFSRARRVVVDRVVGSQAEADALAQSLLDEISGAFIEADGLCHGNPAVRAGKVVKLKALGRRFSGEYFVTAATHTYGADGYTTSFSIHGRRADTLYGLLAPQPAAGDFDRFAGPVIGIVTNNKDPEESGRVKLKFPWLADDVESDWARLVAPGAGKDRGFYCLPEVNDEVLVAFEHGDMRRPYVLGGLWNGQDKPKPPLSEALDNGKVHQRVFTTREGHKLTFTDGPKQAVTLETAKGHRLTLADEDKQVVLETSGGHRLVLDDQGTEIKLTSKGKVTVKSEQDLTVESGANLTCKSIGNLNLEASGNVTVKGTMLELKASGMGKLEAGGILEVKGSLVKIN